MVSNGPQSRPSDPPTEPSFGSSYGQPTGAPPSGVVQPQPQTQPKPKRGVRIPPRLIVGVVLVAIALWFILVNRQDVQIKLWVHTVTGPMWIVLVVTVAVGFLLGLFVRRRRAKNKRAP